MARCDQGYLCRVCGKEVDDLVDSALYLQFVIGWIDPEILHTAPECHLRCNPVLSQFIEDPRFDPPIRVEGDFCKDDLDPDFRLDQTRLVTRGYGRLWEIFNEKSPPPVTEYPLAEALEKYRLP
jgi:hypothetical protein